MDDVKLYLESVLQSVFGYESFKNSIQEEAIRGIISGLEYVCISMPPGFGRSLCYQFPAIIRKGRVAVIFSPKLSFMKEEIDFLRSKHINACLLSQRTSEKERKDILNDLTSDFPTIVLLYATPEMAMVTYFQKLILSLRKRKKLLYIVLNEAHSLSKWGYEYTPCYKNINMLDSIYGYVPRIAVTTTVSSMVIEDICKLLTLRAPKIFRMPVQQINVCYDIWFLDILPNPFAHLKNFIVEVLGLLELSVHKMCKGFAIVYCREEATTELLKNKLNAFGISTLAYHHKLNKSRRHNIESKWISGDACVIATTYNYGFIYKKPIRCIVYWTVPENIPKYYRESAQTDTDSGRTYCRIYFSIKEYSSVKRIIENHRIMDDVKHIKKRLKEYDNLVSYCLSIKCRHEIISKYFEHIIPFCKVNCDVCENEEIVGARTLKFIMYSENVGIKYNICNVNEVCSKQQCKINSKEQSENNLENDSEKSESIREKITVEKDSDKLIVQRNDKSVTDKQKSPSIQSSSPTTQLFRKDYAETNTLKHAIDNEVVACVSKLTIMEPLVDKHNSNQETISLEPSVSKCNASSNSVNKTDRIEASEKEGLRENESGVEVLIIDEINVDKRNDHISRRDSDKATVIKVKQRDKESCKRRLSADTCIKDVKQKRKKLESRNKPTTETEIIKDRRTAVDRDQTMERIKDDANESVPRDNAIIEQLMNKYKLDKNSITLELIKK